jgi:PAS domain S-box-containing protein
MILDELNEKNAFLAAIIESSEDAIISKDLNSVITSWNKAAERMFEYSEVEIVGKSVYMLIPEDRKHEEVMIINNLKQGNQIEHYETIRRTKSGREIHISLTVSPIKNSKGVVVGASKVARDITQQKRDQEIIRQYTQRLELINAIGKTISAQLDVNKILQEVTDATTQLSGAKFGAFFYNKADKNGESYMLYALSGAPREAFEKFGMPRNTEIFRTTFEGKGNVRSEDITKDSRYGKSAPHFGMPEGHLPVVSYLAVPVSSHTGVVIGGLFFGHPQPAMFREEHEHLVAAIATQAAIALDNAKLYEEVHALNTKKDEFIAFASHELKTPLTTISGYMQLAKLKPQVPGEIVEKVIKQVTRLNSIITDLLDLSRIQAGKLDLHFTKISLQNLVKESIDSVTPGNHEILVELPDEQIVINVDVQKIMQVLVNIISNAIKYSTPPAKINVSGIRLGDQVKISIQDQGIGMSGHHLDKIFSQFYRIAKSSNTPGMGLGLFISKEIIEMHFGKIWADSEEGKGSVFHVQLPIERSR